MNYEVSMMKTDSLIPYEDNPRVNDKAVQKVVQSIEAVGWKVPIIVDENLVILAGHTRLKAAQVLGHEEVPVHVGHKLTEEQKRAFRIMDNKSADFSEWDRDLLASEFAKLTDADFDLKLTGFDLDEIAKMTQGSLMEFDDPQVDEILDGIDTADAIDLLETNIKQFSLLYDKDKHAEFSVWVDYLMSAYEMTNPSEAVFQAVRSEYEKYSNIQT